MLELALISAMVFLTYVGTTVTIFNVPSSLSNTFYLLGGKNGYGTIFTTVMFVCAASILAPIIELTASDFQIVAFICPVALAFVGAAPYFKEEDHVLHTVAALIAATSGLVWCIFLTPYGYIVPIVLTLCILSALVTRTFREGLIWWLEMIAFLSVYSCLLVSLI